MKIATASIEQLRGGLVVSCQASQGEPLCAPEHICAMGLSAIGGGARGLRLEGLENVAYVRRRTTLPIIGLIKSKDVADEERLDKIYITPTFEDAAALASAEADIIALDATERPRPGHVSFGQLVNRIHSELRKPVWADVATFDEGISAAAAGADVISTTLSGYTKETATRLGAGPDISLLAELAKEVPVPVVLEGQVWTPEQVTEAFHAGAFAVVVGSAITRPQLITKRFVDAIPPPVIA